MSQQQKKNVEDLYPLAPAQQGMLMYLLISGAGSEVFFDQFASTLAGRLDVSAWRRAWQQVVDRHPTLRTLFLWEKRDQPLQVVRRTVELPWQELDWRDLPEPEREVRWAAFLHEDAKQGFDLGQAPLTRAAVIRWDDETWKFVWSFHHLVLDGWSIGIVLSEALSLYRALSRGEELSLAPARPYRDYISWLQRRDLDQAREFWRRTLSGFTSPTPLAFDGTATGEDQTSTASAVRSVFLPPEKKQALEALARQHQLTLNTLLQGAWSLLLGRYADRSDVVFGGVVSGRPYDLDGVESMVGMFINVLPVCVQVDLGARLVPWLRAIQEHQIEQREYEYSALEQIQAWSGVPHEVRLFDSLLVFENYPTDPLTQGKAEEVGFTQARLAESNHNALSLYVVPRTGLELRIAYHWKRFGRAAVERMLGHLVALLDGFLATPEATLRELSPITPEERQEILAAAQGERTAPAAPVLRGFTEQAARTPEAVAVASKAGRLTYADLDERSTALARHLVGLGVGPESIVALHAERSLEVIVAMLAVWKAGGAYLPLDPAYPAERLAFMLEDSGARVVLTQERLEGSLPASAAKVVRLDADWPVSEADLPEVDLSSPAYVIYTSGSTGRPKGVLVPHSALANYVRAAVEAYGIGAEDRVLQFASISFDTSAEEIYPALTAGATLVLRDEEMVGSLERFARETGELGVTVLDLPTAYWHELVAEGGALPESLRLVILGGEQAQADRLEAWRERVGGRIRLVNSYGPTEATIVSTHRDVTHGIASADVPIGRAIANARTYVLDRSLELVPAGVEGELLIGGAGLARGYLGRPDLTAERFVPDPWSLEPGARLYRSGDLVRRLPDGDLQFRGRVDDQVKVRGFRIELGEIEAALRRLPGVRDAVVAAREDGPGGKRLVAYVVPAGTLSTADLRNALKDSLPEYMVPAAFVTLEALPVTPSGKVDRRALPAPDSARPGLDEGYEAPRNAVQEMLADIWSEILGVERVGIRDDFFHLGGHSLLVARLAARVRQAFSVELPMVEIFKKPTIEELALAVEKAESAAEVPELPPLERAPRDRPIPLSFPQERVWFLDQLSAGGNIAYNFQVTLWFQGPLDVGVFHQTLNEIVRRHEVFRTSFPAVDGQPVQVVHEPAPVELPVIDLRGIPEEGREALAEKLLAETVAVPFDISKAPLIRWRLLRLTDDLWELIQVEHHFVHDGWSFSVFLKEIKALYPAFLEGRPSPLPELPVQYADFAVWQRGWMKGPVMDHLLDFWKKKLAGAPHGLEIPTDRPRPARASFEGNVEMFQVPPSLYDSLRKFSRKEGVTLYMTMLSGFFTLLGRYTGERHMVIGTSNANRRAREIEGMIGMVVNSLLLRGDLSGEPAFRELLGRVRELTLETYAHQDMPFERLVQELRPERILGRNPLFQIMYNFHDAAVPDLEFGGLKSTFLVRGNRSAKMDMNVIVIPRAEQKAGQGELQEKDLRAILHWEYNTDLFDRSTMQRMVGHYLTLLAGVVEDAGQSLADLPLLTAAEREELLAGWSVAKTFPKDDTLHGLFEKRATQAPGAVAVTMGEERLTYAELDRRANRLAHQLRAQGVGPEQPVALCIERSPEMVIGILGILKAGGGYVPLDPSYPAERLQWILEDSRAPVLVTKSNLLESLPASDARVICLDQLPEGGLETSLEAGSFPESLAYVIYTSGSTGRPKGVPIRHANVVRLFTATDEWYGFGPEDVWTLFHSFAFDFSVWELWGALLYGGRLVVVPYLVSRSPEAFYAEIVREKVTVLSQTPSAFRQLVAAEEAARSRGDVEGEHALRYVVFGGEALELGALRPWFARHGYDRPTLVNMYGITETTVHVTYRPITPADLEAEVGSRIGRPIPDLSVHLLDFDLNLVPVGIPGEMHVGGAGLSSGYLNRPDLTADRFIPDPFSKVPGSRLYRSGDLARVRPGGDLEYLGRRDHQVKVRGFRIELGEIEAALTRHPAVREAIVLARNDGADGETRLVAYLVAPPEEAPSPQDLRQLLKGSLPEYMVPGAFLVMEALPLTSHGKVDRKALPAPEASRREPEETFVAPRTPVEETLAGIWSEVLGVERIGVTDDFFGLGGHSLSAARILSRVRDSLRADLSLAVVFESPTVEGMAAAVAASGVVASGLGLEEEALMSKAAELSDADLDALLGQMMTEGERV
ncbi:MAG TPA: amino acid adenylation domain-containing protein [Thermoanaerobaculia bacterium]|nr:amino acid adenylation domain-containing protein [Thermoanaerobaculia bacterium]